jgi:ubiquinone/menaquinone biosynthesis C-methylase UbiE
VSLHPGGRQATKELLSFVSLSSSAKILDSGCGVGESVQYLRAKGYEAIGIDKTLCSGKDFLIQGNITSLPFEDNSFDAALSECVLSICGDTALALKEIARVLKPAGILMVADVYIIGSDERRLLEKECYSWQGWQKMMKEAGLSLLKKEDRTLWMRQHYLQALWEGCDLKEKWGWDESYRAKGYQTGYMLWWAQKTKKQGEKHGFV